MLAQIFHGLAAGFGFMWHSMKWVLLGLGAFFVGLRIWLGVREAGRAGR